MKNTTIFLLFLSSAMMHASAQVAPPAPAPNLAARTSMVSLKCTPFYLPARSIWQRTVDIEIDADGVRTVQIDGAAVYTFNINGTEILTAVDGERIQIDIEALTWSSDLRGIIKGRGNCTR